MTFENYSERARRKMLEEVLAEPCLIVRFFAETGIEVPPQLADLQLRPVCLFGASPRRFIGWHKATWGNIQAERKDLTEAKRWGLLNEVQRLCRMVEPLMRDHPGRTLGEAFALIEAEGQGAN